MRKLGLLIASSVVLLVALSAGAPLASAEPLDDCIGQQTGVRGFHIVTIPDTANAIADVYGGGAICGMQAPYGGEHGKNFYILTAGGMDAGEGGPKVRCANPRYPDNGHKAYCEGTDLGAPYNPDKKVGPFVGGAYENLQLCIWPFDCSNVDSVSWNNVNAVEGLFGIGTRENPYCAPSTVVQCFMATDDAGTGTTAVTVEPCWKVAGCYKAKQPTIPDLDPNHVRYMMTIYEVTNELIGDAYYLEIGEVDYKGHEQGEPDPEDYHVCDLANLDPAARTCGTNPADWVHKNGPAGDYKCSATKPEGYAIRGVTTKGNKYDACDPLPSWK